MICCGEKKPRTTPAFASLVPALWSQVPSTLRTGSRAQQFISNINQPEIYEGDWGIFQKRISSTEINKTQKQTVCCGTSKVSLMTMKSIRVLHTGATRLPHPTLHPQQSYDMSRSRRIGYDLRPKWMLNTNIESYGARYTNTVCC